jgi:hypothetical protein
MVPPKMRRALWFLPLVAGAAGWLLARRADRPALPAAITRALEPARTKPRAETRVDAPSQPGPATPLKRARLPWSHGPE